ncbi:MAG: roadblock/LC7 domain-containing protein [Deltaproteobacteria bacterium]|nr:roadblock/LC7 domain-containing protein [Deltaproteobacteria bacterium]
MPFQQILKDLVDSTPQAVGAIVVDWEGEAVQEYCHCDPYEIRFIAAHAEIIHGRIKGLHNAEQGGGVEDLLVTTSAAHLIIGGIDQDYSLVMNIGRGCPVDLALHHFRTAILKLKKEI